MPLTSIVIFVQLLTGGAFLMVGPVVGEDFGHVIAGLLVFVVAWFGVYGATSVRPPVRAARVFAAATFVLVLTAGLFASKETLFQHYGLAVLAFGTSLASTFFTLGTSRVG